MIKRLSIILMALFLVGNLFAATGKLSGVVKDKSTGEALICGRAIIAPLVVKVGTKALVHGGESPRVCERWGKADI